MATVAGIQAILDPGDLKRGIQVIRADVVGTNTDYYCVGVTDAVGKGRWTTAVTAASDATNAAAITANMAL